MPRATLPGSSRPSAHPPRSERSSLQQDTVQKRDAHPTTAESLAPDLSKWVWLLYDVCDNGSSNDQVNLFRLRSRCLFSTSQDRKVVSDMRRSHPQGTDKADASSSASPPPERNQPYRVAITGHRTLGGSGGEARVREQCRQVLAQAQAQHPRVVALSALAEGADSVFAEVALELGIPLEVVIPFRGYEEDFAPGPSQQRYQRLLVTTSDRSRLDFNERSDQAYLAGGKWVVDRADLLVAVWDGQPARGEGGTADIIEYARKQGVPVTIIPVKR